MVRDMARAMARVEAGRGVGAMAMARAVVGERVVTAVARAVVGKRVVTAMARAVARKGVVAMARVGCIVIV